MVTVGSKVTVAEAEIEGLASRVAVTIRVVACWMMAGAEKSPVEPMLPVPVELNDHNTAELLAFATVAVNCCVRPLATVGFAGVTAMDTNVAGAAVSTVDPTIEFRVAVMLLVPLAATTVARPPLVMVATDVVADAQVTDVVKFCVLVSL